MREKVRKEDLLRFKPEVLISEVNTVGGFSLSPDGTAIAFSWQTKGDSQIFVSQISKFKPTQLTGDSGSKFSPCWSPDGEQIAYLQDKDGNKRYDLYTVNPTGGSRRRVTNLSGSTCRGLTWSPDGRHLAFSSNLNGSFDIYTVQIDGEDMRRLTSGSERDFSPEWSPDGNRLLFYSCLKEGEPQSNIRIINRDGTRLCTIGPAGGDNSCGCWSPDGTWIAFQSKSTDCWRIGLLNVKTGESSWLTKEDIDVLNPIWSPDGNRIACLVHKNVNTQISIIEVGTGSIRLVGPRAGLCLCLEFTPDGETLIFTHKGPKNPTDLWHLTLENDNLRQMTNGLPSMIVRQGLVSPEEISYTSFDGLEIPALLYRPLNTEHGKLPPAVLRLHGGPNWLTFNDWHPIIQLLVSHGYLVLAPNFRGSVGFGEEFKQLSIGDWGGGDLKDIMAAADYLESTGQADPSRIALLGGSYGGYLMLMALAKAPDRWAAGVDYFGFVDLETFYSSAKGWFKEWIENQIGTPEKNTEFYHERSPITHCTEIQAPLLIFQGADDSRVPPNQAKQLISLLESHNKICMLKLYEDEGHGFQKKENQIDSMRTVLDFLNRHLGPKSV